MNNKLKGTISIILAVAGYGMFGTLAKFSGSLFGPFTQNWIRNGLAALFIAVLAKVTSQKWRPVENKDFKWLLIWILSGTLNSVLLFIAFNHIAIGTSYFLLYASMIGTGFIFGRIVFHEETTIQKIIGLCLSFLGLLIIYFLDIRTSNIIYTIFALSAGVMVGMWNVFSKKISGLYPNSQLVFVDAATSFFVGILGSLVFVEKVPRLVFSTPWIAIIIWAAVQLVANGFTIYGFKKLEAQTASIIMPLEVLFGTLFGFLFFKQVLPMTTLIGGLLIAGAAAIASIEGKAKKPVTL